MINSTLPRRPARLSSNGSYERVLPGVPAALLTTDELTDECHRRGLIVLDGAAPRELPGLVVHPGGRVLRWRGVTYTLPSSQGRLLVALCALWPRPISGTALTQAVWGPGYDRNNARVTVRGLRARCPGLIETVGYSGYRLALGEQT